MQSVFVWLYNIHNKLNNEKKIRSTKIATTPHHTKKEGPDAYPKDSEERRKRGSLLP